MHFVFCQERDIEHKVRYDSMLSHLQQHESKREAGHLCLRFCKEGVASVHIAFIALRQRPRYFSVYCECEATRTEGEEYPYLVPITFNNQAFLPGVKQFNDIPKQIQAIHRDIRMGASHSPTFYSGHSLALHLATQFPGGMCQWQFKLTINN